MPELDPKTWSALWDLGNLTSFLGGFSGNYDEEFLSFWSDQLAHKPARVLDVCCGNGSITWIANEICNSQGNCSRITGVDFTDIKPFQRLKRKPADYPMVDFIGNTPVESLPLQDSCADMYVSQYGIEYTDISKAIPEASRVLKQQARIALLMHCDRSAVVLDSLSNLRRLEYLANEGQFQQTLLQLDELYNSKRSFAALQSDPMFNKLYARLNTTLYETKNLTYEGQALPPSSSVLEFMNHQVNLFGDQARFKNRKRKAAIEAGMKNMRETSERHADLIDAAMSQDAINELVGLLQQEGFRLLHSDDFRYRGTLYGHTLVAER